MIPRGTIMENGIEALTSMPILMPVVRLVEVPEAVVAATALPALVAVAVAVVDLAAMAMVGLLEVRWRLRRHW